MYSILKVNCYFFITERNGGYIKIKTAVFFEKQLFNIALKWFRDYFANLNVFTSPFTLACAKYTPLLRLPKLMFAVVVLTD